MPKLKVAVPHQLGQAEAQERIKQFVGQLKSNLGDQVTDVQETWTDQGGQFSFKTRGFSISGSFQVHSNEVTIDAQLPFAALPFKGKIENEIVKQAQAVLS